MAKQELSQELARRSADQDRVKLIQECADLQVGWGEGSWISYTYRWGCGFTDQRGGNDLGDFFEFL